MFNSIGSRDAHHKLQITNTNPLRFATGQMSLDPPHPHRELPSDLDTPVSVYLKLARTGSPSFLLESVTGGEQVGRYSFIGVDQKLCW